MPARCIMEIFKFEGDLGIPLPRCIYDSYSNLELQRGVFVCEFKKHFDKEKNCVREINETQKIPLRYADSVLDLVDGHHCTYRSLYYFRLLNIQRKYRFMGGEYLEVIFKEIKEEEEKAKLRFNSDFPFLKFSKNITKTIPIFPGRMVEDLTFESKINWI